MEELETAPPGVSPQPEETTEDRRGKEEAPPSAAAIQDEPGDAVPTAAEVSSEAADAAPTETWREPGDATPAAEDVSVETVDAAPEPPEAVPAAAEVSVDELLASNEASPAAVEIEDAQLRAVLEAIVYVAEEPLTLAQLAVSLQQPQERIRGIFAQLVVEFDKPEHGVTIREVAGGYKMATKPEHHEAVRSFVKSLKPPLKLSLPALETLAVIAYKQPVTAPEIMEIRGVQGAGVLKTLLDRKLIAVAGRKNVIGKPILYKTTKEFLIQFGLKDLAELPSLKEFEEIRRMAFADSEPPDDSAAPETASQSIARPEAETTPVAEVVEDKVAEDARAASPVEELPVPPVEPSAETAPTPDAQAEPSAESEGKPVPRTEEEG
jgi:segregation and condensation protein B